MAKLERITPRSENFAQWYTDIVKQSELMEYGAVAGTMILKPLAMGIWDNIRVNLDKEFAKLGVENVNFPMLMPTSLLELEKDHISGFAPEVALVTKLGSNELSDPLVIRPTSEALFCSYFAKAINSHNDLPLKYNQWVSVFRAESTTRPFLRSSEFLWQEGHTVHANKREASILAKKMIKVYEKFFKDYLAIPALVGEKTKGERFAGAKSTYTIEAIMQDGRMLQSGTSHYFEDKFAKAFGIKFQNKEQKLSYAFQTSWGISTRSIGGMIMTHSDDRGLVIPPMIAKNKIIINTIMGHKDDRVNKVANQIKTKLKNFLPIVNNSNKGPGFKAAEAEIKGYPIRIEVGPRDLDNDEVVVIRRDTLEKVTIKIEDIKLYVSQQLKIMQKDLYEKALNRLKNAETSATTLSELEKLVKQGKVVSMPWSGSVKDEEDLKEKTEGITPRCSLLKGPKPAPGVKCFYTGKQAKKYVYFGKSY